MAIVHSFCHFCFTQCVGLGKPEPGFLGEGWSLSAAAGCSFTLQPTSAFLYLSISLVCSIPTSLCTVHTFERSFAVVCKWLCELSTLLRCGLQMIDGLGTTLSASGAELSFLFGAWTCDLKVVMSKDFEQDMILLHKKTRRNKLSIGSDFGWCLPRLNSQDN